MSTVLVFIADVHGNYEAFEAVLNDIEDHGWLSEGILYCAGDIIGYGASPDLCINELKRRNVRAVLGNHDAAVLSDLSVNRFNHLARSAISWTKDFLEDDDLEFLEKLPRMIVEKRIQCVHGSPGDPFMEYVTNTTVAEQASKSAERSVLVVGHTHVPAFFRGRQRMSRVETNVGQWHTLDTEHERFVLNPGSVGQPRDSNPDASYMVFDPSRNRVRWERVSYPVQSAQKRILDVGLPETLARRLAAGR